MALSPNVVVVATGDLITAAHLNNIRANLDRLDTTKVLKAGDTMTGTLTVSNNGSVAADDSVRAGVDPTTAGPGAWLYGPLGRIITQVNGAANATSSSNGTWDRGGTGTAAAAGAVFHVFSRLKTQVGSITMPTTTSTAYNTTSDPRTKTEPPATRSISDAADRVRQLGALAWTGQHIDADTGQPDGVDWDFLSSHDVEDVAPYAVTGERDAVDDESGLPLYQQVDFSALVPLLTAALSQALDRIDALEGAGA